MRLVLLTAAALMGGGPGSAGDLRHDLGKLGRIDHGVVRRSIGHLLRAGQGCRGDSQVGRRRARRHGLQAGRGTAHPSEAEAARHQGAPAADGDRAHANRADQNRADQNRADRRLSRPRLSRPPERSRHRGARRAASLSTFAPTACPYDPTAAASPSCAGSLPRRTRSRRPRSSPSAHTSASSAGSTAGSMCWPALPRSAENLRKRLEQPVIRVRPVHGDADRSRRRANGQPAIEQRLVELLRLFVRDEKEVREGRQRLEAD